jgi:hypothetical protein
MYQNFIISYLYEAQHVSGDKPPIIRSLKLHWQQFFGFLWFFMVWFFLVFLVFYTWEVVGRVDGGRCQTQ